MVDATGFRAALRQLATGVTVVTTTHHGIRHGMTVNSFVSVSLDPSLVLFCCEHDATLHEPLLAAGQWAVSVLSWQQQDVAQWFATRGKPDIDQLTDCPVLPARSIDAPLVAGALAWFECRTWATYDGGDHTIVVGEVLRHEVGAPGQPLLYLRGGYDTLDEPRSVP